MSKPVVYTFRGAPVEEFEVLYTTIYEVIAPEEIVIDSTYQDMDQTLADIRGIL